MKHILGVRTEYRRSDWYDGMRFDPANNNILSWRDEDEHFKLRSKMAAGVRSFATLRRNCSISNTVWLFLEAPEC